jgi:membrane protein implicated in regulation of membrane protease activity
MIRIRGEIWQATSDRNVSVGEAVRVKKVEGLKLLVEPVEH